MNPSPFLKKPARLLLLAAWPLLSALPTRAAVSINFDNLSAEPATTTYAQLSVANGNSPTISGVSFNSPDFYVVGDLYVESFQNTGGSRPFIQPESGHYGIFNAFGNNALKLVTTQTLTSIAFARADLGAGADANGPTSVTVKALDGVNVLGSATLNLTDGTMRLLDTSAFTSLSGITGYQIDRVAGTGPYGGGLWVADDLTFGGAAAVPEPMATSVATACLLLGAAFWRRHARRLQDTAHRGVGIRQRPGGRHGQA